MISQAKRSAMLITADKVMPSAGDGSDQMNNYCHHLYFHLNKIGFYHLKNNLVLFDIDLFTSHRSALGLMDSFFSQVDIMFNLQRCRNNYQISSRAGCAVLDGLFGISDVSACGFEKMDTGRLAVFIASRDFVSRR
jgi:hypothetical protein